MGRRIVLLDSETTGLDPQMGAEAWEYGLIEYSLPGDRVLPGWTGIRHLYRVEPDLAFADEASLDVCRYRERTAGMLPPAAPGRAHDLALTDADQRWSTRAGLAAELIQLLDGRTVVCAVPTFDIPFARKLLDAHAYPAPWHYRVRDIESIAWGWLARHGAGVPLDAGLHDLARAIDVDPDRYVTHTALGDCDLMAAILDRTGVPA
ncbi:MAG: hypothetical protein M0030_11395 [Actinomycetota bacterium]|jgi:hypothetical protein|nr:hypothetical protein [Actinomycetota bacterium]